MRDMYYLRDDRTGKITTARGVFQWGRQFELSNRDIVKTYIGDIMVSTVFLGLDHRHFGDAAPILFETMVFGGALDVERDRYETEAQARRGHLEMLQRVIAALEGIQG